MATNNTVIDRNKNSDEPPEKKGLRVCILDVARGFTIEATHPLPGATNNDDKKDSDSTIHYPHDADEVLRSMIPSGRISSVEVVYLKPGPRVAINEIRRRRRNIDVFLNLYDLSDPTGQQIVDFMEENGIAFTGAGSRFYDPPRRDLKTVIRSIRDGVDTPLFAIVSDATNVAALSSKLGLENGLFVKPEHGYDSVGIDEKSLVYTVTDLQTRVDLMVEQFGGALIEQYVDGREFSVLVAGSKEKMEVFPPVEYVFPKDRQRTVTPAAAAAAAATAATGEAAAAAGPSFITFQDKWGANFENRWRMLDASKEAANCAALRDIAFKLYEAFDGQGLCRFDVRQDGKTGKFYVLDANPNCSLFYKDDCTADTIIRESGWGKDRFMEFLLSHGLHRQSTWQRLHAVYTQWDPVHGNTLHAVRDLAVGDLVYTTEMTTARIVTRTHVDTKWLQKDLDIFDQYAWPLGPNVYAIWDEEPKKWRPINHSCEPNCWMSGLDVVARRPIAKDEELTLNYSTFAPEIPPFDCWCKSVNCQKRTEFGEWKSAPFIARYRGHCSPMVEYMITKHLAGSDVTDMTPGNHQSPRTSPASNVVQSSCTSGTKKLSCIARRVAVVSSVAVVAAAIGAIFGHRLSRSTSSKGSVIPSSAPVK